MAQAIPLPPDHAQRRRILEELDTTMLVEAAAGTGKTTSMVGRMVALLREGKCDIDTLAAVTFTRKAAAELRARFQVELERAAREAQGEAKQRLARAQERAERCLIGTIHSFCARLLRERPIEAGVGLVFHEMEKDEDLRLRDEAWSRYVARLFADDADSLTELRELGLEIGQLRDSFVMFGTYPDVNTWPAPDVDMGNLDGGRRSLEQYVAHMEELIPTFPVERGTDELMSAYERVERLARDRDLGRTPELLEVLALFKSSQRANQGAWPGGQEQGRREVARWRGFAETTAQPLVRRWQARRYATVMRILAEAAAVYDRLRAESGRLNYQDLLVCAARLLCDQPPIRRYFS
ncbi:MAG: UvrD-helicase domain-containing protein, partial [Candidatus Brocadiia bacterium]